VELSLENAFVWTLESIIFYFILFTEWPAHLGFEILNRKQAEVPIYLFNLLLFFDEKEYDRWGE